jgi:hypothetical protein
MMSALANVRRWTIAGRTVVFVLASSSIACLLAEFYAICPMRLSTPFVFCPALLALLAFAWLDPAQGDRQLQRAVWIGLVGGLLAAIAYDLFRLPFVFAKEWGIASVIPPMNLFKVFPRFGALILGEPIEQSSYSLAARVLGWAYHFSNGGTFGIMYMALIGNPRGRRWTWAVVFALTLELGVLLTPYPAVFSIPVTSRFVLVTMAAHGIFGLILGGCIAWLDRATVQRASN